MITRRRLLASVGAGAGTLAAAGRARVLRAADPEPPEVDVHCHVFNGSDLPVAGFVAHVAPVHASIVRKAGDWFASQINRRAPDGAAELAKLADLWTAPAPAAGLTPVQIPEDVRRRIVGLISQVGGSALRSLNPDKIVDFLERFYVVAESVTHFRYELAATLVTTYAPVSLFTPCLVDYDAWSEDHPQTPLEAQIPVHATIAKLSMRGKIGRAEARLHPFVPFDPRREVQVKMAAAGPYRPFGDAREFKERLRYDCGAPLPALTGPWEKRVPHPPAGAGGIELVRYAVEQGGFLGVKMYPPVGFLPLGNAGWQPDHALGTKLDLALRAFFAYCEAEEVPITAHSSGANGYGPGFGNLASPNGWATVLAEFPRLRLNLGHFGHVEGITDARGVKACESWMRKTSVLMQRYPNVFADMSNSPLVYDDDYADKYFDYLTTLFDRDPKIRKRVMYGSDWWLNRLGPKAEAFAETFHDKFQSAFGAETRRWVMGGNALRFLGLLDDQGQKPAASRNRQRLQAFYDQEATPPWL